ncbi:iron-containing redox enzyme family protein [Kitasatospora sp. NBC_00458]|uniref:iron-containing redox enzyme family protein n=1 Tax=Kitasatospora sp. NBC_00458 TaxID=2903568 RepID=UPI002E186446
MIETPRAPRLPAPRGPLSECVRTALATGPPGGTDRLRPYPAGTDDPWGGDLQLALYVCYELHYRGFEGVDPDWEWDPELLRLRRGLERHFLAAVREETGEPPPLDELLDRLLTEPRTGTGPSHFLLARGERWQAREYLVHRSLYHLKEADPQLWAAPRLGGAAQAAFLSVEYDEYGAGHPDRAHSRLFAEMMADFGLDPAYGRYVDAAAAPALAVVDLMSLFGLHRALRGALVGQFAAVEITSSPGSARLARAFERLGAGPAGTRFYEEHVEADAVHEQLVRHGVIAPLLASEPGLAGDVAFGIAASSLAEDRLAAHLTASWAAGHSSLRGGPLTGGAPPDGSPRGGPLTGSG